MIDETDKLEMSRARSKRTSRDRGEIRLLRARLSFESMHSSSDSDHADEGNDPWDHREDEERAVVDADVPTIIR